MNITTELDKIKSFISYFKSLYQSKNIVNPSYVNITSYNNFLISKQSYISKLSKYVNSIPPYHKFGEKTKNFSVINQSISVNIHPNEHILTLKYDENIGANDIPLVLIDENYKIFDARIKGGGLTESYIDNNYNNSKLNSISDISYFRGMPTQAASTIIVKFPSDTLNKYSKEYLESVISKYSTSESLPYIKTYTADTLDQYGWNLEGSENI